MELLVSFLATLILLAVLFLVLRRARAPAYRPSRRRVLALLEGVAKKQTSRDAWDLFVGLPILHDPELEQIRRRCLILTEGDFLTPPCPSGIGGYLFNRDGRARIEAICADLRELIRQEPFSRSF